MPSTRSWRLRTRLIVLLMALLAVVCALIGVLTYVIMKSELTARIDDQLRQTTGRVDTFRQSSPTDSLSGSDSLPGPVPTYPGETRIRFRVNPILAPSLPLQAVTMEWGEDGVIWPASRRTELGQIVALESEDQVQMRGVVPGAGPTTVGLSTGSYRMIAVRNSEGDVTVTGLPLADRNSTLSQQVATMSLLAASALLCGGVIGMYLVRRELRPLETVADVARDVAALPLYSGAVRIDTRVPVRSGEEGTEVGTVGSALNQLLDSVDEALVARHASETKVRRFVADASHELRTPLAAIRGYAEMLRLQEPLSEEGKEKLRRVETQGERMSRLVEDLLTLARLDGAAAVTVRDFDLGEVVLDAVMDAQVAARDHEWTFDLPDEPVLVRADTRQLEQVVSNLLSNARKHTDPGTTVVTRLRPGEQFATLTVTDNGPGIDPAFLPIVFDRFARADAARSGSDGTSGLGLAIVQAIVQSSGGRISVRSRPGHTEFEVLIPMAPAGAPAGQETRPGGTAAPARSGLKGALKSLGKSGKQSGSKSPRAGSADGSSA